MLACVMGGNFCSPPSACNKTLITEFTTYFYLQSGTALQNVLPEINDSAIDICLGGRFSILTLEIFFL